MGSTAAAQADHLPPTEEVQLFGHNGALALSCSQTVTAVESERKHLIVKEEEERRWNIQQESVISRAKRKQSQ